MIDLLFYAHMLVILILLPTDIAAYQYSHVSRFPNQAGYNEYYNYVVDICDIVVKSFAARAQAMLVDHLQWYHYLPKLCIITLHKLSL